MSRPLDGEPLKAADIRRLVAWLARSRIGSIEVDAAACRLRIVMGGEPHAVQGAEPARAGAAPAAPVAVAAAREVRAPGVGIFLRRHPAARADFRAAGDRVSAGDCVGLVRVGIALLPVRSAFDGILQEVLVADGERVEWGTPLFRVDAAPGPSTSRSNT